MQTLNSKILLCKDINVDKNYINVLDYSESQMLALCQSSEHLIASQDHYSFIRNKGTISTDFTYSQCLQANYIAFQNSDYSNKWFFAFIDDVIYNGESNTELKYTVDVWSTWFDKWTPKSCYVVREHVNDDTIGANTIDESINTGEMISEDETKDSSFNDFALIIESDYNPETQKEFNQFHMQNGNFFGSGLYIFRFTLDGLDTSGSASRTSIANAMLFMSDVITSKTSDFIKGMFVVPTALLDLGNIASHTVPAHSGLGEYSFETFVSPTGAPSYFNVNVAKKTSFSGYNVKNNKCLVFPYNYLLATNNAGNQAIYKYEDFLDSNNATFQFVGALQIGGSGRLIPRNYRTLDANQGDNVDESLPLGKYPTFEWSSDAFTNWLTENAVNIASSVALGVAGVGASAITGGLSAPVSGAVATGAGMSASQNILSLVGGFVQANLLPNITGGQNTGDVNYSAQLNGFTMKRMRPKLEFLRIIDDYFSRFGYKINRVKTPNLTGRAYWNYIEIGPSEEIGYGDVPSKYMEEINQACKNGVTIWHNHANIGNYSLQNTIVS